MGSLVPARHGRGLGSYGVTRARGGDSFEKLAWEWGKVLRNTPSGCPYLLRTDTTDLTEFDNEARGILAWTRHVNIGQAKALWREAVPTESPLRKRLRKKNRRRPE